MTWIIYFIPYLNEAAIQNKCKWSSGLTASIPPLGQHRYQAPPVALTSTVCHLDASSFLVSPGLKL